MTNVVIGKIVPQRPGSDVGHAQELEGRPPVDFDWGLKGRSESGWHSPVACFIKLDKGWQHVPGENDEDDWTDLVLQTEGQDVPLKIVGDDIVVDLEEDEYVGHDGDFVTVVTLEGWYCDQEDEDKPFEQLVAEAKALFPRMSEEELRDWLTPEEKEEK